MTGQEFYNKVKGIKTITDIRWHQEGDALEPDVAKVVVIADGEVIEMTYPRPGKSDKVEFIQFASMALIINKFMEQIGNDFRTCLSEEMWKSINYSIKQISGMKGGN